MIDNHRISEFAVDDKIVYVTQRLEIDIVQVFFSRSQTNIADIIVLGKRDGVFNKFTVGVAEVIFLRICADLKGISRGDQERHCENDANCQDYTDNFFRFCFHLLNLFCVDTI